MPYLSVLDGHARWPTRATGEALVNVGAVEVRPPDRSEILDHPRVTFCRRAPDS